MVPRESVKEKEEKQWINAIRAIPGNADESATFNTIYCRQAHPRLPRKVLKNYLRLLVDRGEALVEKRGKRVCYKRSAVPQGLAVPTERFYNGSQRIDDSLDTEVDRFRQALAPLRDNKIVRLWMDAPLPKAAMKSSSKSPRKLVVITPGPLVGFPRKTFLVSIVRGGSCMVRIGLSDSIARLMLASMPSALAKHLMQSLSTVME